MSIPFGGSLRAAGVLLLMSGCAVSQPRVEELGENSYMLTVEAAETPDGKNLARREAMARAEAYCVTQGRHARPTHMTGGVSDFMQGGEIELNFRCQDQVFTGP